MITISDNDLKQLLRFALALGGKTGNTRTDNQLRIARNCAKRLMKRSDVKRIMNGRSHGVVADSTILKTATK